MRQPRPGRTARWVIGIIVTLALALVAVIFGLIFVASGHAGPADAGRIPADARATATVLDIDAYDSDDDPIPAEGDWARDGGYADVDIDFRVGAEHEVTVMDWPDGRALPAEGDRLTVGYDPTDPEYEPALANPDGTLVAGSGLDDSGDPFDSGPAPGWVGVVAAVLALLAVLSLTGTVFWARRAARVEPVSPGGWGPPGPGWNQPGPGWGQPQPMGQAPGQPNWNQPGPYPNPYPAQPAQYPVQPGQYPAQPNPYPVQPGPYQPPTVPAPQPEREPDSLTPPN